MSGREFKTGEFDQRLRDTVRRQLRVHGIADDQAPVTGEVLSDALFAGLKVLLAEILGDQQDAAPPVRELPIEPGAVVLATEVHGLPYDPPLPMMRTERGTAGTPWCCIVDGLPGLSWSRSDHITKWVEATVIPTAAHEAAVKALRDVVELLNGPQSGDVQEAQDAAINALAGIEGWAGL